MLYFHDESKLRFTIRGHLKAESTATIVIDEDGDHVASLTPREVTHIPGVDAVIALQVWIFSDRERRNIIKEFLVSPRKELPTMTSAKKTCGMRKENSE